MVVKIPNWNVRNHVTSDRKKSHYLRRSLVFHHLRSAVVGGFGGSSAANQNLPTREDKKYPEMGDIILGCALSHHGWKSHLRIGWFSWGFSAWNNNNFHQVETWNRRTNPPWVVFGRGLINVDLWLFNRVTPPLTLNRFLATVKLVCMYWCSTIYHNLKWNIKCNFQKK